MRTSKYIVRNILLILLSLNVYQCSAPSIDVENNFTEDVVIEVYSGEDLFYDLGSVAGYSLQKDFALEKISIGGSYSQIPEEIPDRSFLIVIGTIQGSAYAYLSSITFDMAGSGQRFIIDSTGALTVDSYY